MAFKTGHKKKGGRTKGVKNKLQTELRERIAKQFPGYCPVEALCRIAENPITELQYKVQANKEVAQYIYPKLKSIDHNHGGQEGNPVITQVEVIFKKPKVE